VGRIILLLLPEMTKNIPAWIRADYTKNIDSCQEENSGKWQWKERLSEGGIR
jgi:hypothetical protein